MVLLGVRPPTATSSSTIRAAAGLDVDAAGAVVHLVLRHDMTIVAAGITIERAVCEELQKPCLGTHPEVPDLSSACPNMRNHST